MNKNITLGSKVRDSISGFAGVAVAKTEWLNGCIRITIAPSELDKDGKVKDSCTFDAQQVEVINAEAEKAEPEKRPGGPFPAIGRNVDPK